MHSFCCYSSSENIDCLSIQAVRKKYANIKCTLDFYYYWQHFRLQHMARVQYLMHIYLFGVCINRILILQLKTILSVKFMFSLILYVILLLFFISML